MASILLTQGYLTIVDQSDVSIVHKFKWCADIKADGRVYARGRINGRLEYLHRYLMGFPDSLVDHEDRDTLNNRRSNLRIATDQQNSANQRRRPNEFQGVKPHRAKFIARVKHNYIEHYVGLFDTPEEAARAYDKKGRELSGEFAYQNFPEVKSDA